MHYAAAWGNVSVRKSVSRNLVSNIVSFLQKDLVIPFMSKGWNPMLKDKTGLTVKNMADVALWNKRGDITVLFM